MTPPHTHTQMHVGTQAGLNATTKVRSGTVDWTRLWVDPVSGRPVRSSAAAQRVAFNVSVGTDKQLSDGTSPNRRRRNSAHFVPACDFKECQKLINISE